MDPERALKLAQTQLHANRYALALEALLDYYNWRAQGGFQPVGGDKTAATLGARLVDAMENLLDAIPPGTLVSGSPEGM